MQRSFTFLVATLLLMSACTGNVAEPEQSVSPALNGSDGGDARFPLADGGVPVVIHPAAGDTQVGASYGDGRDGTTSIVLGDAVGQASNSENPCAPGPQPLARDVRVRELSIYQTVKIPLYQDNAWVATRNASVVQGKKSLVRAFVEPMTGFTPRMLRGLLTLDNEGSKTVLTAERNITGASAEDAATSTFDFKVEGALIGPSTQLSVAVLEPTCSDAPATASAARVPATGTQAIDAVGIPKLRVVMVPVTLDGRTPDTGEAQLTKIREALKAYYPVPDVEVSARAPIEWTKSIGSDGAGWSELLMQIQRTRQSDMAAGNAYYFGLITPAASFRDFCRTGCVLGLAPQTTVVSRSNQIGLGVGFVDENTYTTVVHELGHAHGLPHAPCVPRGGSIQGADTRFPYPGAKIGSWGWDSRSEKLMSPATYADVMSYCEPTWISDYNYEKIAARCRQVNTAAFVYTGEKGAQTRWHGILLSADGTSRWSGTTLDETPGEITAARALDDTGDEVAEVAVVRVPLSHSADSFLYVAEPDPSWAALDLGDRTLVMSDIAEPLE